MNVGQPYGGSSTRAPTSSGAWVVGPLVLLVVIVLCALATFFWGMPRVVADVITKGIVFGYLLILFIYQLRAKRRTAAIGTAVIAFILAI